MLVGMYIGKVCLKVTTIKKKEEENYYNLALEISMYNCCWKYRNIIVNNFGYLGKKSF